jgi:hypothetical protein
MKSNHKRKYILKTLLFFSFALISIFGISCNEKSTTSKTSESELINKVNAVHQQIMKQGNITDEEAEAILSLTSLVAHDDGFKKGLEEAIEFNVVENPPVFPSCEDLPKEDTKNCFTEKVNLFISDQFNTDIPKKLGITEIQNLEAFFRIDKSGEVTNFKVRDANPIIQAEALRVLRLLPQMKPATQNGETVNVVYGVTIPYGGKE